MYYLLLWFYGVFAFMVLGAIAYAVWSLLEARMLGPRFEDPPLLASPAGVFSDSLTDTNAIGRVGELLTALIMINHGWRQLPSHPKEAGGLDGIFIRKLRRDSSLHEVCLVETKTTTVRKPLSQFEMNLSDAKVRNEVEMLRGASHGNHSYLSDALADAIVASLGGRSKYVTKKLFYHSFLDGETEIYDVAPDGSYGEAPSETLCGSWHSDLMEALEIGLARIVTFVGVEHKTSDIIDPAEVTMSALPASMRPDRMTP